MICSVVDCGRNAWKAGKCYRHTPPPAFALRHLPSEPLVSLVEKLGGPITCGATVTLRRAYVRAKTTGRLTDLQADRLSFALLGRHPCELWTAWFDLEESA